MFNLEFRIFYKRYIAATSTLHKTALPANKLPKPADPDPDGCEAGDDDPDPDGCEAEPVEFALLPPCPRLPAESDVVRVLVEFAFAGPVLFTARFASTTFKALSSWPKPVLPSYLKAVH